MGRPPRITRSEEKHVATARPLIGGESRGRLDIDVSGLPKDMEPTWIREVVRGQYDEDNISSAMERGYTPVMAEDLPGYRSHRLPGAPKSAGDGENLIRRGGMVLMARPKVLAQQERALYTSETKEALRSVARDTAAPKDGKNFQDMPGAGISTSFETAAPGRFSE